MWWTSRKPSTPLAPRAMLEPMESRVLLSVAAPGGATVGLSGEHLNYRTHAVEMDLGLSSAPRSAAATATVRSAFGGNLNMQSDRVQDHPFTDLVKTTRGFYNLAGRLASNGKPAFANTTTDGWPTESFMFSVADNSEYGVPIDAGTYKMSFKGPSGVTVSVRRDAPAGAATVPSSAPLPTLQKLSYDATTGTHTYDIVVPNGVLTLALEFRNTSGSVRNIVILQPGYSLSGYPTLRNEYTALLKTLFPNVLRLMDFTQTNNNPVANWSERTLPTAATQTKVGVPGDLVPAKGIAWEYAIGLANQVNADVWINIPARATNDYVTQLATLLKKTLKPHLNIYFEYSNEVWNTIFNQTQYNLDQAKAEVAANPNSILKYDGTTDSNKWADRRYARRVVEIGGIFKWVWTNTYGGTTVQPNPTNTRVRAVLASQYGNQSRFDTQFTFLNKFYGAPRNYIYGMGVAPYINLGSNQNKDGLTKDQVLNSLRGSVNALRNGSGLSNAKNRANTWGVKLLAYEGGIDTFGDKSIAAKRAAVLDPQIQQIVTDYMDVWYDKGGNQFNWYTLGARSFNSPNGTWSITEDIRNYNQPKEIAYRAVRDWGRGN